MIDIINADCRDALRAMEPGSIDAVVSDPPYGTTQCQWDAVIPFEDMWAVIDRVLKPGGAVVLTACMPFTAALVMSRPSWFRHHWVWEKNKATGHLNAKRAPMRAHEDVLVFCAKQPRFAPQMTEGHKPGNYAKRTAFTPVYGAQRPTEYGGSTLRYPRSVQKFDIVNNDDPEKWHKTQKPVDLFRYLVRTYTAPGDVVLDFACGSAAAGVAALAEGRSYIGIDDNAEFASRARRRLGLVDPEMAEMLS